MNLLPPHHRPRLWPASSESATEANLPAGSDSRPDQELRPVPHARHDPWCQCALAVFVQGSSDVALLGGKG